MNCAILLAAGSGSRMVKSVEDKVLFPLKEVPVILYSIKAFINTKQFDRYLIVYRDEAQKAQILKILPDFLIKENRADFIKGGNSRQASVFNALQAVELSSSYVAIHDVARPLITSSLILELLAVAKKHKNAIPATLMTDTIKHVENEASGFEAVKDMNRSNLRSVQTPQIFNFTLIHECYRKVIESRETITDDSSALASADIPIKLVINDVPNPKITTKNDLDYILYLLNRNPL